MREFKGVLITKENYKTILEEGGRRLRNFHNRHLKAYKRGEEYFMYKDEDGKPSWHKTDDKLDLES